MKKFCLCAAFFCLAAACFAENEISDFCQKKIDEFVTLRVELKSDDDLTAVEIIKNIAGLVNISEEYKVRGELLFTDLSLTYLNVMKNNNCPVCGGDGI